jgi:hypothetical protein
MPEGYPSDAICVQKSDDSRNSAIRIAYRTSLRSSSVWEPRHPSLKIFVLVFVLLFSNNKFYNCRFILEMALRQNLLLLPKQLQQTDNSVVRTNIIVSMDFLFMLMILPQVHLRKPCYDFSFL